VTLIPAGMPSSAFARAACSVRPATSTRRAAAAARFSCAYCSRSASRERSPLGSRPRSRPP
ncbi:hypothetical protein, partial [Streptosporangium sp. NPDC003464]